MSTRLSRAADFGRPSARVRMVHLGVGNFFRAHQAWYTDRAPDAAAWGIAGFTGRSPAIAEALTPQDGLYALVTRGADGDTVEVISALSAVHAAADHDAWLTYLASADVALVTMTVTEAGYRRGADGGLDETAPDVAADLAALRSDATAAVVTAPAKIAAGLLARRASDAGALTLVPCDNLSGNGAVLRRVVIDAVTLVAPEAVPWVEAHVSFATTMVDRITPATTDDVAAEVERALGVHDAAPVPTEPFSEWVIEGDFPAGRPAWDAVGALLVDDVAPYEHRKLALLNGSHSLLAYAGPLLGHETVADAIADPRCLSWVQQWWDEACAHIALPAADLDAYRAALLGRFSNPAIRHLLAQIAADGSIKLPVRILPTLRAELAEGRVPVGACRVLAAWTLHLRGAGAPVKDVHADEVRALAAGSLEDSVQAVLGYLDPALDDEPRVVATVLEQANLLSA